MTVVSEAVMTYGIFDPFVKRAQECISNNDAQCAEELVVDELNTMIGYKEEFTPAQQNALDEYLAKLIEMIPDDSEFWQYFWNNPEYFDIDDNEIILSNPTRSDKDFIGWKYDGELIDKIDSSIINSGKDITLEAVWSNYTYSILEDDNGDKYHISFGNSGLDDDYFDDDNIFSFLGSVRVED